MAKVLDNVGERTIEHLDYVGSLNIQLWATLRAMGRALPFVGNRYRWQATVRQMLEIGVDAMPMVSLMAICTGFILAMQGASELRRFGAMQYVIDLVAVGFTRELGPLLTAIAVSGRSGSAFAAEIGTMKVTEELDSLRVMALEPVEFVLAPKYLAALISVPCLSIISNCLRHFGRRFVHVLEHSPGAAVVRPLCVQFHQLARRDHRIDQERGVRNHHCSRWMPGRVSCPRRPRFGRSLHHQRGGEVDLPRHRRGCGLHCHLLFHGETLMPIISVRDLGG